MRAYYGMAYLDGLESHDDVLAVYKLLEDMEFNGGTVKCGIYEKKEAEIEPAKGDGRTRMVGVWKPFPEPRMRFVNNRFIPEKEQQLHEILACGDSICVY